MGTGISSFGGGGIEHNEPAVTTVTTDGQATHNLPKAPDDPNAALVFYGGRKLTFGDHYNFVGTQLQLINIPWPIEVGDRIEVYL